jgi:hypothetical protein
LRAPPDHEAAGYTVDDDGTTMSINVEMIGTALIVQNYRYKVAGTHYCKMVPVADVLIQSGRITTHVTGELPVQQIEGNQCRYTNTATARPTEDFPEFITPQAQTFGEAA